MIIFKLSKIMHKVKVMNLYKKRIKISAIVFVILYLVFLIWGLYFKFGDFYFTRYCASILSKLSLKERFLFDIIPFDFSNTEEKLKQFLINILNLIIFMPFGIALPIISGEIKWKKHGLICFFISLAFEITQLFTLIGGFAADDLLMNTLGYFAGALIYKYMVIKIPDKIIFYILLIIDSLLIIVDCYVVITIIPLFSDYIQIIKDYARF